MTVRYADCFDYKSLGRQYRKANREKQASIFNTFHLLKESMRLILAVTKFTHNSSDPILMFTTTSEPRSVAPKTPITQSNSLIIAGIDHRRLIPGQPHKHTHIRTRVHTERLIINNVIET